LVVAIALIHFFVVPVDVLWFRALRKLEFYAPAIVSSLPPFETVGIPWSA
jgi:hypothetical protein